MGYVKLHDQLFTSSIIEEDVLVRWVWIAMLLSCDRNGNIHGTVAALARKSNVPETDFRRALDVLMSPDSTSTSPTEDGRRVIETGANLYHCVNYTHYRGLKNPDDVREATRRRVAKHRAKKKDAGEPSEDPIKAACHQLVTKAVECGLLVRPTKCEQCGTYGPTDGHHEDYSEPLEVQWLCRSCHSNIHNRNEGVTDSVTHETNRNTIAEAKAKAKAESICIEGDKPPNTHTKRFTPPTVDEVRAYMLERGTTSDPERFVDFYESKGWMVGKNKMKDWKAAVRNWERNAGPKGKPIPNSAVDSEWVYDSYRRTDREAHREHERWDEYVIASVEYSPRQAPTFETWLEEHHGQS